MHVSFFFLKKDTEPMKNLSTITPTELFTGWSTVRWVRALVLMLIPIGIVDSVYTIGMTAIYGYEVEFNPITRELLAAGYWFPWSLINILGFTFFCMMAGSYYLHTRWRPSGPDTFAFSFVIALRIAMVAYNVTFFYIPWIGGMAYPPFWTCAFSFVFSLYLMNKLLKRQYDISWAQTKYYFTSRLVNYRDAKLITSTGVRKRVTTSTKNWNKEAKHEVLSSLPKTKRPWWRGAWLRRVVFLGASLFSFVLMGISLQFISEVTGLSRWSEVHGPFFILNEITGPPVMASVLAIVGFISLSLAFIYKAFSTSDELEF
ncbi:MAG: hypothetical protein C4K48_04915 [Candidatus Thorarchaeota archaeon]|nr:MAG: hypothetical protein C4K48_04915 [Candidatus Thorarchaeota archaeon]